MWASVITIFQRVIPAGSVGGAMGSGRKRRGPGVKPTFLSTFARSGGGIRISGRPAESLAGAGRMGVAVPGAPVGGAPRQRGQPLSEQGTSGVCVVLALDYEHIVFCVYAQVST